MIILEFIAVLSPSFIYNTASMFLKVKTENNHIRKILELLERYTPFLKAYNHAQWLPPLFFFLVMPNLSIFKIMMFSLPVCGIKLLNIWALGNNFTSLLKAVDKHFECLRYIMLQMRKKKN